MSPVERTGRHWSWRSKLALALAAIALETIVLRSRGYRVGRAVVVRCQQGHLFTTIWLPAVSVKSLRLGWWRIQRCPVGRHWSIVTPVREADLTTSEQRSAHEHRDLPIP